MSFKVLTETKLIMNTKLVDSLVQIILSLDREERTLLQKKLFSNESEPSTLELMLLSPTGNSFDFLLDEPNIYTSEDGEPVTQL